MSLSNSGGEKKKQKILKHVKDQVVTLHLDYDFVSRRYELQIPLSSKKSVLCISGADILTYHLSAPISVHIRLKNSVSVASGCLQDAVVTPGLPGLLNKVYLCCVAKCCLLYNAASLSNCQGFAEQLLIICFLSRFLYKGEILKQY